MTVAAAGTEVVFDFWGPNTYRIRPLLAQFKSVVGTRCVSNTPSPPICPTANRCRRSLKTSSSGTWCVVPTAAQMAGGFFFVMSEN
jgi:hypothetical protein